MLLAINTVSIAQKEIGFIQLKSSDSQLEYIFSWAKEKALSYTRNGDPVGKWYEAALPGRDAFCMRDASHQCLGAYYLGLSEYNKNIFGKFTASVAALRDWCGYWEIDKQDRPAPVDYRSDQDFWYNLPANFDVMNACWELYNLTGDTFYISGKEVADFFSKSVTEYVERWDSDNDGIMDSPSKNRFRGLASYYEANRKRILTGADLLAAQAQGFAVYAKMQNIFGKHQIADNYVEKSEKLKHDFDTKWWDENNNRFYSYIGESGDFGPETINGILLYTLHFGFISNSEKIQKTLSLLKEGGSNVEENSYIPSIFFNYGEEDFAYKQLIAMTDSSVKRRDYPEVSFAVIDAVVEGLMGVRINAPDKFVEIQSHLPSAVEFVEVDDIPFLNSSFSVKYQGKEFIEVTLKSGENTRFRFVFEGEQKNVWVNGKETKANSAVSSLGEKCIFVELEIKPGEICKVSVFKPNTN